MRPRKFFDLNCGKGDLGYTSTDSFMGCKPWLNSQPLTGPVHWCIPSLRVLSPGSETNWLQRNLTLIEFHHLRFSLGTLCGMR
ncbi:uncharacterized [Tachysurus ichikawai]